MLQELVSAAQADRPLWLPDVRARFLADPEARRVILRLRRHDGRVLDFPCPLPRWESEPQRGLVRDFFFASLYNALSVHSAEAVELFFDRSDAEPEALVRQAKDAFQLGSSRRSGYGKVVSVAARIGGGSDLIVESCDLSRYAPVAETPSVSCGDLAESLRAQAKAAAGKALVGVDVGGTDIKLAAALDGRLLCVKEYDWNPASCTELAGILDPILLLTRLMRACLALAKAGLSPAVLEEALRKDASDAAMQGAVEAVEARLGEQINVLDGVGVSFPDVVIGDRIVGGETPKTDGLRRNPALDYEQVFAEQSELRTPLLALCREGGRVHLLNDGNMAAYTAAMELAHGGSDEALRGGVVAHSLGTDLGSGWLLSDGTAPPIPLELYDLLIDLGSRPSRDLPPQDLRSTCNENSGLPGVRRYVGQSAAFRLARKLDAALLEGFAAEEDGMPHIPTAPVDRRKACLEQLIRRAAAGDAAARELFRQIGEHLAVVTRELDFLARPEPKTRFLFGRMVKEPACFALLREGFARREGGLTLLAADEDLAFSPLMRQLSARGDVTAAQFGQAVGAVYYAMTGEEDR